MLPPIPLKSELIDAMERVKPYVHRTPILTSRMLNEMYGNSIYFKCENFQRMGAFKMRGAVNAILQLGDKMQNGVVTHSSGNFAQALSLAARELRVPAYIVMPKSAPEAKKRAVEGYGGIITISESTIEARETAAARIVAESGGTFIHPSDNRHVILGQGTAACELLEEHSNLDAVFCPVGGGGLIGGTALAVHYLGNSISCYGGEPEQASDARESFLLGKIVKPNNPETVADGLKTYLGEHNFPIIQELVHDILLVSEEEIVSAMRDIYERMKIVVEPSSAVALAAVKKSRMKNKEVGIILSGGNVDLGKLPF